MRNRAGKVGKAGSGDLGGPVQLRCSVPGCALITELAQCRHLRSKAVGHPPGRQLCGRSFHLTVTLLLNFILNSHKLLFLLLINMCCFKMRRVYTASLSNALRSPGFFPFHLI